MDGVVWFGILGPLEVTASGRPVTVAGRSQRELLAVLLLRANRPVEVDFMIDSLWPGRSPPSARRQIQNSVGRLRRTLVAGGVPATTLETRRGGYLLRVLPGELDALLLLRSLGQLLVEIGRLEHARPHLERAPLAGRDGDRRVHAEVLYWLGQLHLAAAEVGPAGSAFKDMLAIAEDLADPREEAEARYGLGLVRLNTGALGAAAGLFRQALALNRPLGEPLTEGRIRTALGILHCRNGQPRQAIGHLTEAAGIFDAIGIPLWSGRAYRALADAREAHGDRTAADAARKRALTLFTSVGAPEAADIAGPDADRPP
ncbi:winged helix-turn-helix domain-containing protein [Nonomuraea sp. C10]|uniref:winged helix-turn-helix domain-containing protein n=1 Tax=Nonomuraea sp. C10 TaxID=2600577 RepID=UPI0011CDC421|nr:winged helix-turn-helix domain-containing protein [Nonomuraea sp. C10]TXK40838.1 hypothetical protein FR742_15700 [Nonomuraea sp. C10]